MLRFTPNATRLHSRATVIVSKKTSKSAARRNRIRRRVYEILRNEWDNLEHAHDIALTAYSVDIQFMPHEQLVREVTQLLSTARLYKDS